MRLLKFTGATLAWLVLAACAGSPAPQGYGPCAADPGSQACQIERYQNAR